MTWTQFAIYAFLAWVARSVYKDTMRSIQAFPTRLRWRRPMECGVGAESLVGLVECERTKRPASQNGARVEREKRSQRRPTPAENARRYAAEGGTW